jgi:hypothetical protein
MEIKGCTAGKALGLASGLSLKSLKDLQRGNKIDIDGNAFAWKIEIGIETETTKCHKNNVLETVLREKCGLCDDCIQLYMDVDLDAYMSTNTDKDHNEGYSSSLNTTMCPLCLVLLSKGSINDDTFHHQRMNTSKEKFQPYSNSVLNHEGVMDMNTNMCICSSSLFSWFENSSCTFTEGKED